MRLSSLFDSAFKRAYSGRLRWRTSSSTVCSSTIGGLNSGDSTKSIWCRKTFVSGRMKCPEGKSACPSEPCAGRRICGSEDEEEGTMELQVVQPAIPQATSSRR